ncbi:MAG: TIGR00730 family Rossman fold protein, partial [Bdellovibrionales bacterium]
MTIESVCVYSGSSVHVAPLYKTAAQDVGRTLAQHKLRLIYGGGLVGLMGLTANAALNAGGEVIGIIPEHIRSHEIQHPGLTEMHVVDNMHIRKSMMAEKADAFVALPGGFGTLDELFEIMTWKQIALHTKPILIYNVNNFWDPLLALIDH